MADLLIRGMEMPKMICGEPGYVDVRIFSDGIVIMAKPAPPYYRKFETVPLPEGHGDLIDRDALRAENGLNAKCEHCPTNTYECRNDMIHTKMDFCEMLDDATVIVPAEGGNADG